MNLQVIKDFFRLVRWFHELLAILPFIGLYAVIKYYSQKNSIDCSLPVSDFIVLCLGVQLLLAAGCILNDIMDRDIDKVNKPSTYIINRTISLKKAWILYGIFTMLIILVSFYISMFMFGEWVYISISVYVLSILYDVYLKRSPMLGNILMAVLTSFIPLVIVFFARECLQALQSEKINALIYIYAIFPPLIVIPRELSLDISDMEGDKANGCKTLPIVVGARRAKHVVTLFLIFTILLSFFGMFLWNYHIITFTIVDILISVYIYRLQKTNTRTHYIRIGRFIWFAMILGLIGFTIETII